MRGHHAGKQKITACTFLLTLEAMISLLVSTRFSTECAAPFVTLKVGPLGGLMVASVLCKHRFAFNQRESAHTASKQS